MDDFSRQTNFAAVPCGVTPAGCGAFGPASPGAEALFSLRPFRIDSEFHGLIPPLASDELAQLEANIIADGCREPLVVWRKSLLDGHNRYEICTRLGLPFNTVEVKLADRDAATEWIIRNQFGRRNITIYARAELALKLEPIFAARAKAAQARTADNRVVQKSGKQEKPIKTEREIAKLAGVSHDTIAKAKLVRDHASEDTKKALRKSKDKSLNRVAKELKETIQRQTRQSKRATAALDVPQLDTRIIIGDFRKHAKRIADGSLSLVFTDPPYNRKASVLLADLAAFAAAKLADGGSLICYVGQTQLPTAIDAFRLHLRYWWTIACIHAGHATVMREYGINAGWKAVLWFVKQTRDDNSIMVSDVMSGGQEKTHHEWQQAESEAAYWIENLCPKDGVVCDPFLGGGTTAVAAESLNRQWLGFEIEKEVAMIAGKRIYDRTAT